MSGLDKALAAVKALRGENGCPWDKEQSHSSLRKYLLEETFEALEALDNLDPAKPETITHLKDELGDVLFQVLLHSEIASESGAFTIDDVASNLAEKLVRRHPHVFGGKKIATSQEVLTVWEASKQKEKKKESILDGIPTALPALQRGLKVIEKVSQVGFQWPDLKGPMEKLREELGELEAELDTLEPTIELKKEIPEPLKTRIESELGDLLFSVANVAYFLNLNPEDSLRTMLTRFEKRFRYVEKQAMAAGNKLQEMTLDEMDVLWKEAKKLTNSQN